jgi:hypothetical protein
MTGLRACLITAAVSALGALAQPGEAQLFDRLKKKVAGSEAARSIRCGVGGVCGTVRQSDLFEPTGYESIAVTVFDGTGRFREAGTQGMVRDAFESRLIQNGYLLAASSDAAQVRAQMARGDGWTDADLTQLKDFITAIDAVVVIDIRRVDAGRCTYNGRPNAGTQATVHISARWLNVDAGDVPWVATHNAIVCAERDLGELHAMALKAAAEQLARSLPSRNASPTGKRSVTSAQELP